MQSPAVFWVVSNIQMNCFKIWYDIGRKNIFFDTHVINKMAVTIKISSWEWPFAMQTNHIHLLGADVIIDVATTTHRHTTPHHTHITLIHNTHTHTYKTHHTDTHITYTHTYHINKLHHTSHSPRRGGIISLPLKRNRDSYQLKKIKKVQENLVKKLHIWFFFLKLM